MTEPQSTAPVSVIIPCYRCKETVVRALDSVLAQTARPAEVLLIDDASGDGTLDLLHELALRHSPLVKVIEQAKNGGPGVTRNAGWEVATQPWLAFLDADDAWHPRKLEIQSRWMSAHAGVVLTGHQTLCLAPGEDFPEIGFLPEARPVGRMKLLFSNRFPTRTVMLRRDLPLRFDPVKRRAEDYLLWLRIVLGGWPASVIELPLACSYKKDFGHAGLSADLWKMERSELDTYRKVWQEGLLNFPFFLMLVPYSLLKFARRILFRAVVSESGNA